MMILQVILEGIGLGVLLILVCAIGIRKGAVGMVHLYSPEVQERCVTLGLTTHAKIKRNALIFKAVCVPGYIAYVLVCVYALNGARGFLAGFWQISQKPTDTERTARTSNQTEYKRQAQSSKMDIWFENK